MNLIISVSFFALSLFYGIVGGYFVFKDKNRCIGILLILAAIILAVLDFCSIQQINRIEKYSNIAKMQPCGSDVCPGKYIHFTGGLGGDLQGTYTKDGNKFTYNCSDESINKLISITENYPDFPFSYYGLATCKKDRGIDGWEVYAKKAIEIFEQTTKIDDHNSCHDDALKDLRNDLNYTKEDWEYWFNKVF